MIIKIFNIKINFANFEWKTYIPLLAVIITAILFVFSIKTNLELKDKLDLEKESLVKLEKRANSLQQNKMLVEDVLPETNRLLGILIPESEDYFSIFKALEKISEDTHFLIENYKVSLSTVSRGKINISIQGSGDPTDFIKFLKNYSFAGGRLITSEKIEYSASSRNSKNISLSFYSGKPILNESTTYDVSKANLDLIEKIRKKTTFVFTEGEMMKSTASGEIGKSTSPF